MKSGYRQQIGCGVSLLVIALFFISLYILVAQNTEDQMAERLASIADSSAAVLENHIDNARALIGLGATLADDSAQLYQGSVLVEEFSGVASLLHGISFSRENGLALFDAQGKFYPVAENTPHYAVWKDALTASQEEGQVAGPFPCLIDGEPELAVIHPLIDKNADHVGGVAFGMSLTSLVSTFEAVSSFKERGRQTFLLDNSDHILFALDKSLVGKKKEEIPLLRGLPRVDGPLSAFRHTVEEEEYVVVGTPVGGINWYIYVLVPTGWVFSVSPYVKGLFIGSWLFLSGLALLFFYLMSRQGHYKNLSELDHLTGARNRLAFDAELRRVSEASLYPVTLLMLDVDGLKVVNDALGHESGDALLRRVTHLLHRSLRDNDIIYRIGGDEFVVIFPSTPISMVEPLAERVKVHFALAREKTSLPPIYISQGLAEGADRESLDTLYTRADSSMYSYKQERKEAAKRAILQWMKDHPQLIERRGYSD